MPCGQVVTIQRKPLKHVFSAALLTHQYCDTFLDRSVLLTVTIVYSSI